MSAPSATSRRPVRRAARALAVLAAVPAALALSALPAGAVPTEGDPTVVVDPCWRNGAGEPAYPGQRYGCDLPAELRGPVQEF
jgi:hypothetical protein